MKGKLRFSPPAVGGASLLVSIFVLCLTVFALLSLSPVQADTRLAIPGSFSVYNALCALGVAVLSAEVFNASMVFGAFLSGMVVGQSKFASRAASDALPMRDAFAVLFFVSVGMGFDAPMLLEHWQLAVGTLALTLLFKPLSAYGVIRLLRRPGSLGVVVGTSLSQIGEFSFILAALAAGDRFGLLPREAVNVITGVAIITITLNVGLFRLVPSLIRKMDARGIGMPAADNSAVPEPTETKDRVLVVGYGPCGELLIDYSIYDAVKAGLDRVVFIIRKDIEQLFKSTIGERASERIKVEYVYQSTDKLPCRSGDFNSRTKPWGTAHALWCCKDVIDGPFAVINADDFYGRDAFMRLGGFLSEPTADGCSVGFMLKNTLSDYGTVNRGICKANDDGMLLSVEETRCIKRNADGTIAGSYNGEERILDEYDTVSMSMWGFGADFMPKLEARLCGFLDSLEADEPKAELTIADVVDLEIHHNGYKCLNLTTDSEWFGITYAADVQQAKLTLIKNTNSGIYKNPLW